MIIEDTDDFNLMFVSGEESEKDDAEKGVPKKNASGKGKRANKGRGGCEEEEQEKKGKGKTDAESTLNPMEIKSTTGKVLIDPKCVQTLKAMGFTERDAKLICAAKQTFKMDTRVDIDYTGHPRTPGISGEYLLKPAYHNKVEKPSKPAKIGSVETAKQKKTRQEKETKKEREEKERTEVHKQYIKKATGHQPHVEFSPPKRGGLSLPLEIPMRPPKSMNRLQVKMERLQTEEEKYKTSEELEKRATYARQVKKRDSDECVSRKISIISKEYPNWKKNKVIAVAYDWCRKHGNRADSHDMWAFVMDEAVITGANPLNNVIRIPVTLAREMVQPYQNGKVKHFKPYEELKKAIDGVDSIPIIIEHHSYTEDGIVGWVKQLYADDESRSIKGLAYITKSKIDDNLYNMLINGLKVSVSIGFWAMLGEGGIFNDEFYDAKQIEIEIDHLAIVINSIARCSVDDGCGMNVDSEVQSVTQNTFKYKPEYYLIITDNYNDLEETESIYINDENGDSLGKETDANETQPKVTISHVIEDGENITVMSDEEYKDSNFGYQTHETSGTGEDLDAILTRLWKFIGGIASAEAKKEAMNRILKAFKSKLNTDSDLEMDENEFKDALENKDAEIEELKKKLNDSAEKMKAFEEKEKKRLIDSIKEFAKYEDSELDEKCLDELEIIADAVSRFEPSKEKPKKLPKEDSKNGSPRINPSTIFAKTNE